MPSQKPLTGSTESGWFEPEEAVEAVEANPTILQGRVGTRGSGRLRLMGMR